MQNYYSMSDFFNFSNFEGKQSRKTSVKKTNAKRIKDIQMKHRHLASSSIKFKKRISLISKSNFPKVQNVWPLVPGESTEIQERSSLVIYEHDELSKVQENSSSIHGRLAEFDESNELSEIQKTYPLIPGEFDEQLQEPFPWIPDEQLQEPSPWIPVEQLQEPSPSISVEHGEFEFDELSKIQESFSSIPSEYGGLDRIDNISTIQENSPLTSGEFDGLDGLGEIVTIPKIQESFSSIPSEHSVHVEFEKSSKVQRENIMINGDFPNTQKETRIIDNSVEQVSSFSSIDVANINIVNGVLLENLLLKQQNMEKQEQIENLQKVIKELQKEKKEQQKEIEELKKENKKQHKEIKSLKNDTLSIINIKMEQENQSGNSLEQCNQNSSSTLEQNNQNENGKSNNQLPIIFYKEKSVKCGYAAFKINLANTLDNIFKMGIHVYTNSHELLDEKYIYMNNKKSIIVHFPTNKDQFKYIYLLLYDNENEILQKLIYELRDEKWYQREKQKNSNFSYETTYKCGTTNYDVHFTKKHGNNKNDICILNIE